MDILKQYEQQSPDASRQSVGRELSQEAQSNGPIVRFVIKISGGLVSNARQANSVLAVAAIGMIVIAVIIFIKRSGGNMRVDLKVYKSTLPPDALPQRGGSYPTLIPR